MRLQTLVLSLCWPAFGLAADAGRGAGLYLQLPGDVPSCVSCHGADPAASRNNILRAADQPTVLLKTLGTVSAMGYLRMSLSDADIADLAAYLGGVAQVSASTSVAVWPRTVEFGTLTPGASSAPAQVVWRNRSAQTMAAPLPRLARGRFTLDGTCRDPVPPGGECRVGLRALAGAVGDQSDVLLFEGEPAAMVGVSARVRAEPGAVWLADVDALDFAVVEAGRTAQRSVRWRNAGTAAGVLGVSTLTGPDVTAFGGHESCTTGLVLQPGQSCLMSLTFRPGAAGPHQAMLQLRADGAHPQTLALRGQGASAPEAQPPGPPSGDGGGGGCASAPPTRPGDLSLPALALAAAAALRWRQRRAW